MLRSFSDGLVGHKTQAIYTRYALADDAMLREGTAKLAAYLEGEVQGKVKAVAEATAS